ncbi:hypothetical protein F5Y07DRAFT_400145 [Xylaria sp. FL0933]|nr:hypothetical protein F5Y07DRAFT_400145 [Xylaria sp. FL0933]
MCFTLAICVSLFAAAMAISSSGNTFGTLERKCLAKGTECYESGNCCSGVCTEDHGCGCLTLEN